MRYWVKKSPWGCPKLRWKLILVAKTEKEFYFAALVRFGLALGIVLSCLNLCLKSQMFANYGDKSWVLFATLESKFVEIDQKAAKSRSNDHIVRIFFRPNACWSVFSELVGLNNPPSNEAATVIQTSVQLAHLTLLGTTKLGHFWLKKFILF